MKTTKADLWRSFGLERPSKPRWTTPEIKGIAWEFARRYVRHYEKDCYTCDKTDLIANGYKADTGHFKPVAIVGSNNVLSWDKRFLHLQCSHCNGPGQGMALEYAAHIVKDYGQGALDHFEANWRKVAPVKNWQEIIDSFRVLE